MSFKVGDRVVSLIDQVDCPKGHIDVVVKIGPDIVTKSNHLVIWLENASKSLEIEEGYLTFGVKRNIGKPYFRKLDEDSTSNFKSNVLSKQLAQKAQDSNAGDAFDPQQIPEHLEPQES